MAASRSNSLFPPEPEADVLTSAPSRMPPSRLSKRLNPLGFSAPLPPAGTTSLPPGETNCTSTDDFTSLSPLTIAALPLEPSIPAPSAAATRARVKKARVYAQKVPRLALQLAQGGSGADKPRLRSRRCCTRSSLSVSCTRARFLSSFSRCSRSSRSTCVNSRAPQKECAGQKDELRRTVVVCLDRGGWATFSTLSRFQTFHDL